ncbi:MAG: hypothetical protein AABX07_04600 [Nanoarchaeota archaeon]|mgnify:CR=1 FL=1
MLNQKKHLALFDFNYFFLLFSQKKPATNAITNKPAPRKDEVLVDKSAIVLPVMLDDKNKAEAKKLPIAITEVT